MRTRWAIFRPLVGGFAAGAVLVWIIVGLPAPLQLWALVAVIGVSLGWAAHAWWELRKIQRQLDTVIEDWDRRHG